MTSGTIGSLPCSTSAANGDDATPAMNRIVSPGRKNPTSSPVSAKITIHSAHTPADSSKDWGFSGLNASGPVASRCCMDWILSRGDTKEKAIRVGSRTRRRARVAGRRFGRGVRCRIHCVDLVCCGVVGGWYRLPGLLVGHQGGVAVLVVVASTTMTSAVPVIAMPMMTWPLGGRRLLHLEQVRFVPLRLVRRLAATQAEQPLRCEEVDDRRHVDDQGERAQPGDLLDEFVHLDRDERRGRDHGEVFAPSL